MKKISDMKERVLVHGVGFNDADYVVQKKETIGYVNGKRKRKLVWMCPYYKTWKSMLSRCYSVSYQKGRPTYIGCSVSEEWKRFTNFRNWMKEQDWKNKDLDKDILLAGNKVYSEQSCVFVSSVVNSFVIEREANRGEWPIGVSWHRATGKFISSCNNPFSKEREHLGLFDCEHEAHKKWLTRKLELAELLAETQTDERVAKALIDRYTNYL